MSKTPRTDEHLRMKEENGHVVIVSRDFARQLETELVDKDRQLAEARAEIESLKLSAGELNGAFNARPTCLKCREKDTLIERKDKLIERMRQALDATDEYYLDKSYAGKAHNTPIVVKVREAQAALEAAERGEE